MINLSDSNYIKTTQSPISFKKDDLEEIKKNLENSDITIITKLYGLKNALCNETLNMSSIKRQIDELCSYKQMQNYAYLNDLLCPEKARGVKIPSQIPLPSCSFQLHNSITLTTNASGNVAFLMNPFFLADETAIGTALEVSGTSYTVANFLSSAWVNNNSSLTGNASDTNWVPINFGQTLPAVYDQYRLVSASLIVRYIGRLDQVQGEIGGAIFYDDLDSIGGQLAPESGDPVSSTSPSIAKYGYFDYAQDAFYSSRGLTLEGIRMLYFPLDNSYEEYVKTMGATNIAAAATDSAPMFSVDSGQYKGGFNWFFWAQGAPASSPCFKLDIYCNFECLPAAKFLNYMPITVNPMFVPVDEKKKWLMYVQSKPIMKANEDISEEIIIPSIFTKMIKKFKNGLPGFERLRACGLIGAVPGLKPGLALAGNMIASQWNTSYC